MITLKTQVESLLKTDKNTRYMEIFGVLKEQRELTAREICYELKYSDLNAVKPRLTELCQRGIVEVVGKKVDKLTNRKVAVFKIVKS